MNKVREVRNRKHMALQELAVKARVAPGMLTMIERYHYIPGPAIRQRISQVLGVADTELFAISEGNSRQ